MDEGGSRKFRNLIKDLLKNSTAQQFLALVKRTNLARGQCPLGLFEFAPPLEAHAGYEQDPIVLGIMANGVGTDAMAATVRDACTWVNIE
mgnify:CR=1 FL=1